MPVAARVRAVADHLAIRIDRRGLAPAITRQGPEVERHIPARRACAADQTAPASATSRPTASTRRRFTALATRCSFRMPPITAVKPGFSPGQSPMSVRTPSARRRRHPSNDIRLQRVRSNFSDEDGTSRVEVRDQPTPVAGRRHGCGSPGSCGAASRSLIQCRRRARRCARPPSPSRRGALASRHPRRCDRYPPPPRRARGLAPRPHPCSRAGWTRPSMGRLNDAARARRSRIPDGTFDARTSAMAAPSHECFKGRDGARRLYGTGTATLAFGQQRSQRLERADERNATSATAARC